MPAVTRIRTSASANDDPADASTSNTAMGLLLEHAGHQQMLAQG